MAGDLKKVLAAWRSQIGYDETPVNKNRFSTYWHKPPEAWCADFATWGLDQGGALDVVQSSFTPTLYQRYVDAGRAGHTPKIGALAFFQWPGSDRIEHVAGVEGIRDPHRIITLEGNTSPTDGDRQSQRMGGSVARKVRSTSLIVGYGYPKYGAVAKPKPKASARPVLMAGAHGQAVLNVQIALNRCGNKIDLDGQFGAETTRVLNVFKTHRGLPADGTVDAKTWQLLGKVMGH